MKWLEWAGVAIGCVVLTAVALYGLSRWLGPSAEQERALALMSGSIAPVRDPFAPFYDMDVLRQQANREFDQGRVLAAFDRVCREVVAQRRAGDEARDLLGYMGAARVVEASSQLFAELLVRSPAGQPLPPSCKVAFSPPQARELSLCEAFRGELALRERVQVAANLFYDPTMTDARLASGFARACGGPVQLAIAQDPPLSALAPPRFGFDCIRNFAGCLLVDTALPAYRDYMLRAQEHGARMRLASTVHWLHVQADAVGTLAERLASRPDALHSPDHPVEVVDGGAALRIRKLRHEGEYWELPLAPPR